LLWRLFHTLVEQGLELVADLFGFAFEFVQELPLFVINLAVREEHSSQPGTFLLVDPAIRQDVVLDRLVKELLEGRRAMLYALVQFHEEVSRVAVDLSPGVQPLAQDFQFFAFNLADSQDVSFDLVQFRHDFDLPAGDKLSLVLFTLEDEQ